MVDKEKLTLFITNELETSSNDEIENTLCVIKEERPKDKIM